MLNIEGKEVKEKTTQRLKGSKFLKEKKGKERRKKKINTKARRGNKGHEEETALRLDED